MPKVIHYEIPSDDPEKTMKFYNIVFGWTFKKWDGPIDYWFIENPEEGEEGIDGAIAHRQNPEDKIENTIGVKDIKKSITRLEKAGGTVLDPVHPIPGVGWIAYVQDLDRNRFGMMQEDPTAK